jgi:hypothetical protein
MAEGNKVITFKKEKTTVKSQSPDEILIYSKPKIGKTDLVSRIEDCGIIELEGGANYVNGYVHDINNLDELDKVLTWLETENPYKYVAFDTMTRLEEWCEVEGTLAYMNSTQGKAFNRVTQKHIDDGLAPQNKLGKQFPPGKDGFESVHTLGQGYGYRWSRESYQRWFLRMKRIPNCRKIFIAHIKDKYIESKAGDQVLGRDIDLTGKLKSITTSFVDTIGYLHRGADGNTYLSFNAGELVAEGSRSKHLTGQDILVGEWDKTINDYSKVHWDKIYVD